MAFNSLPAPVRVGIGCECSPNNMELIPPILTCICSSQYWTTVSGFESLFSAENWLWIPHVGAMLSFLGLMLLMIYQALYDLSRLFCYLYRAFYRLCQRLYQRLREASRVLAPGALGEDTETRLRNAPQEKLDDPQTALGQLNAEHEALYQRLHRRFRLLEAEDSVQDTTTGLRDTQQEYLDTHETASRKVRADQLNHADRDALKTSRSALDKARQAHHKALETRRDARGINDWTIPAAPAPLRIRTYIGVDVKMTRKGYESVSKGHEDAVRRACAIAANKHKITKVLIRSVIHNTSGEVYEPSHVTCNFYDPDNEDLYRAVHVYVRYANLETGELSYVLDANTDYIPDDYAWERVMYERDSFLDPKYEQWMQAYGAEVWADGKDWSAAHSNDWHDELDRLEEITRVDIDPVQHETPPDEQQPDWQDEGAGWPENYNSDEQNDTQDGWLGTIQEGQAQDNQDNLQVDDQMNSSNDNSEDESVYTGISTEESENVSDQTDITADDSEDISDQTGLTTSDDVQSPKVNEKMRDSIKDPYHLLPSS